jgi:hypothetical protein
MRQRFSHRRRNRSQHYVFGSFIEPLKTSSVGRVTPVGFCDRGDRQKLGVTPTLPSLRPERIVAEGFKGVNFDEFLKHLSGVGWDVRLLPRTASRPLAKLAVPNLPIANLSNPRSP